MSEAMIAVTVTRWIGVKDTTAWKGSSDKQPKQLIRLDLSDWNVKEGCASPDGHFERQVSLQQCDVHWLERIIQRLGPNN